MIIKREATLLECYQALRYNGFDVPVSLFYGFVMYMRKTMIEVIYE